MQESSQCLIWRQELIDDLNIDLVTNILPHWQLLKHTSIIVHMRTTERTATRKCCHSEQYSNCTKNLMNISDNYFHRSNRMYLLNTKRRQKEAQFMKTLTNCRNCHPIYFIKVILIICFYKLVASFISLVTWQQPEYVCKLKLQFPRNFWLHRKFAYIINFEN